MPPVLSLRGAGLSFPGAGSSHPAGALWSALELDLHPGELLAVLGGNGSGKTSLVRCILGLQPLTAGTVRVGGMPAGTARRQVGYVPQQRRIDPLTPLRARDLVGFGLDGHRWAFGGLGFGGLGFGGRVFGGGGGRARRQAVEAALDAVGALEHADAPLAQLSGGQQQLVRIAQALVGDPRLLLLDEPLLSLDLNHQRAVASVVNRRRSGSQTAVVFVTHEINPILPYVDRVLYLAAGRFTIGTVEEVLTSATLSSLYDAPVDVLRVNGRIVVLGVPQPVGVDRHGGELLDLR